jgi:GNAT superfamily N-acetyltransferase
MSVISTIEKTFFANGRYWGSLNASLSNRRSVWSMKTGIQSADLNMAWSEIPLTGEDVLPLRQIKTDFKKENLPFWWWVFPSAKSATTLDLLKAEGFSFVMSIPCMLADLRELTDSAPSRSIITLTQVRSKEELNLWRDVSFAGFEFPQETGGQYDRFVDTFNHHPDSPQKFFLAYANGKPVGTSLVFQTENAAGIYFVTTLAEHRKKGIGLELTEATLRLAKKAGARFATLQSSPDGLHVYEQAGFKEYCRVDVYSL